MKQTIFFISILLFTGCFSEHDFGNLEKPIQNKDSQNSIKLQGANIKKKVKLNEKLLPFSYLNFHQLDNNLTKQNIRNILDTFTYGGFVSAKNIERWINMPQEKVIEEILNFNKSNTRISSIDKFDRLDKLKHKDIVSLAKYWYHTKKTPLDFKTHFNKYQDNSIRYVWSAMVNRRGLNPFREKIGLFEINHIGLKQNKTTSSIQLFAQYRDVLQALENGQSYDKVLSIASLSSGTTFQYGNNENIFLYGKFSGNNQFARKYYESLFKVMENSNKTIHEFITIRNTAKILTDITGYKNNEYVSFNSEKHYISDIDILKQNITGLNAKEKIFNLSKIVIKNDESMKNLPVFIIQTLADDNLSLETKQRIINSWQQVENKSLLRFLQAYALSKEFHSKNRFKYRNVIDKNFYILNKLTLNNRESYYDFYSSELMTDELFSENKTGIETSNSPEIFKDSYNQSTKNNWVYLKSSDNSFNWKKDWTKIIPKAIQQDKNYFVKDIAKWLWNYVIGDNLQHYGKLEQAHLFALLNGKDLGYFLDPANPEKNWTQKELESLEIQEKIIDAGNSLIYLNSKDSKLQEKANRHINRAFAFIVATPYIFIDEN